MSAPPLCSRRSLAALEYPQALALVAELASTDIGRREILDLRPVGLDELLSRRRRLEEVASLAVEALPLPAIEEPLEPLVAELSRARPEIDGAQMLVWAGLLRVSGNLLRRVRASEDLPGLTEATAELLDLDALALRITRTLDERGAIRDDASERLSRFRRRVAACRQETYSRLRGLLKSRGDTFSEDTIPLHDGRLVLMLRASDRGRAEGLVHGRSSTGRSLYFEPLSVVESNNALQEAQAEEENERRRIMSDLREAMLAESAALRNHLAFLAGIDRLQAAWRFGERTAGRLAEIAEGDLTMVAARHPLLDPVTVSLRREALGASGHEGAVTPLDLELGRDGRVLVITGPNAGGKTVALKTVGLLVALHQSGLPVPVADGTRLPVVDSLVAVVGDEQDLMRDRSTFSGRLLRLREAWEAAGPGALVLLDELGSGTDPQEGAALAQALLERLAAHSSTTLVTTHLIELASVALELNGAICAAMEFDRETGRPTYRLVLGPPGGSEAIRLGRQLELPSAWLDRASALVGPEHRSLTQILAEVEALRGALDAERVELAGDRRRIDAERAALETERDELATERKELAVRQKRELAAFRRRVRERLDAEVETLREQFDEGRRRGLADGAVERLFESAPESPSADEASPPPAAGDRVRHVDYSWEGTVEKVSGDEAEVLVHGKRLRCPVKQLSVVDALDVRPSRTRVEVRHEAREVKRELRLIGRSVEAALDEIDGYLDRAVLAGLPEVRLVHGHGSGRLRRAVRGHLEGHPSVDSFRAGGRREGGEGATVVILRL